MKTYDVFGIGNALMDILVPADEVDLDDFKLQKGAGALVEGVHLDFFLNVLKTRKAVQQAGGSVSNTMAGIACLGGRPFFTGAIGEDQRGQEYEMRMLKQGVGVKLVRRTQQTGTSLCLVTPDGQRTFAVHLGAATQLLPADIPVQELKRSKILHLEGYLLEDPLLRKTAIKAMKIAARNKIIISLDLSDHALISRNLKVISSIVRKYANIVFVNEAEAEALTGRKNPEEALKTIASWVKLAIVKVGKDGSFIMTRNRMLHVPAYPPVKVVDTTGAGDMYAAAILYGIARGLPLEKAGQLASYASTKIIEQMGARLEYSLKHIAEVAHRGR